MHFAAMDWFNNLPCRRQQQREEGDGKEAAVDDDEELWHKRRTSFVAVGIIFIFLALFLLLLGMFLFLWKDESTTEQQSGERPLAPKDSPWGCTTLDCSLNFTLNPCHDFYEFVCSGFMHDAKMPSSDFFPFKSQFNILWEQSYTDVIGLLTNHTIRQSTKAIPQMQQLFAFYDSCMDSQAREANRSRGLFAFLREVGFEAGSLRRMDTDWLLRAFPFVPFVELATTWDVRPESQAKSMFLFKPVRSLTNFGAKLDADPAFRLAFAERMAKLLRFLVEDDLEFAGEEELKPVFVPSGIGPQQVEAEIERRVQSLIQMEIQMAEAIDSNPIAWNRFSDFDQPELYVRMGELRERYGLDVDWLRVFRHFAVGNKMNSMDDDVLVMGHQLLLAYSRLVVAADPQVLSDYLDWALVWRLLFELDSRFARVVEPWPKDGRRCVRNFVRVYFPHWLDRLYVEHVFDGQRLAGPNQQILRYVKAGFSQLLDESHWMDGESKRTAKHKLASLRQNIGHFQLPDHDQMLGRLYGKYALRPGMPWAQMVAQVHRNYYLWPTLDFQASFWVDGFYKWVYNSLAIYGAIIRPPWFNPDRPPAMNFGAMGTFMGHEVTHGFDSIGWHFDGRGNLKDPAAQTDDAIVLERMERRMACFVDQYGGYEGERPRPSPRFTLAENIADNGAIRASFNAWLAYKAKHPSVVGQKDRRPEPVLERFSDEQLFFIASAFIHCAAIPNEEVMADYARNDNHGMPWARVNLPLRNFDAFARTFQCPIGSKMNPAEDEEQKCRLW